LEIHNLEKFFACLFLSSLSLAIVVAVLFPTKPE
jgi:hypothetical protein